MTIRLIISGINNRIPADAFQRLASEGTAGPSRSTQLGNSISEVPTDPTTRGGRLPQGTPAADLCFWFLCLLIFVATPFWIALS